MGLLGNTGPPCAAWQDSSHALYCADRGTAQFLPQTQTLGHQLLPACQRIFFVGHQGLGLIFHIVEQSDVRQGLGADWPHRWYGHS